MTSKDDNGSPLTFGVSHLDGVTPVVIQFEGNKMKVDRTTSIAFDPDTIAYQTDDDFPITKAVDDSGVVLPIVVNATTGAVLVDNS